MNSYIVIKQTIYFLNEYFFVILMNQELKFLDPGDPELFTTNSSSNW